jgi:transposase
MASLQRYQSHGIPYYRIVESFRKNGKPRLRVLAHLGRVEDILKLHQERGVGEVKASSVSAGAVTALHRLALELDVAGRINRALAPQGKVQVRDQLTVGESLVAAMIARACAPRSKRAFADWAKTTYLPELMQFTAADLTSQHFWDQMDAVPVNKLAVIEQDIVREMVRIEQLELKMLAYDTTNFYTHIASTNLRPKLPQRGHNKQGRHDLRQLGLALVVDQDTQLPLSHALYEGACSDMRAFAEFLQPLRQRLRQLSGRAEQFTIVFDAGASSKKNLETTEHYVTAVRPSHHGSLLEEAAAELVELELTSGVRVRAWRSRRVLAGAEREVVVVFSPQLYEGQLRGLDQAMQRCARQLEEMRAHPSPSVEAATRKLNKIRGHQYLRTLLSYQVEQDQPGAVRFRVWSNIEAFQHLTTRYFGLRVLITDHREWSTAQIIEAYRGQSKAESAFRDLKDPRMLSTRPQFHWTDQKLRVHAFLCVTAYLLVTLLHRRARLKTAYAGGSRRLLAELGEVRCCRLIDMTGHKGRPRVRLQLEEIGEEQKALVTLLGAAPTIA